MPTPKKISLAAVIAPAFGIVLDAPPVLVASDHSVDYTCERCSTSCCTRGRPSPRVFNPLHQVRNVQFAGYLGPFSGSEGGGRTSGLKVHG